MFKTRTDLLTISQVADEIGVSPQQVYNLIKSKNHDLDAWRIVDGDKVIICLVEKRDALRIRDEERKPGPPTPRQKTPKKKKT